MKKKIPLTREQWLNQCISMMLDEISILWEIRSDLKIRVSVGHPPGSKGGVIGVCHPMNDSKDGHNEIFINPILDNSKVVLTVVLHEVLHAVVDCKGGHRGEFAKLARLMGFIGRSLTKMNTRELETELSPKRLACLAEYIDLLGPIPHQSLEGNSLPKQTNRQRKVYCSDQTEDCGFAFRTSVMQINKILNNFGSITCPNCGDDMIVEEKV